MELDFYNWYEVAVSVFIVHSQSFIISLHMQIPVNQGSPDIYSRGPSRLDDY